MHSRQDTGRVLVIGLDGYEASFGDRLMSAGELPALARLRIHSARYLLDHRAAQRTGLAWEHVSSGRSPEAANRFSSVSFNPQSYEVWQEGSCQEPFTARIKTSTVVFDVPYYDLNRAPLTRGVVNWGAHDPGVHANARPLSLLAELESHFGQYPAQEWIYAIVWPSAHRTRQMGDELVRATDLRAEAASWLLGEHLPDWQLGIVVASELHSATEGLWHGVDPTHQLHQLSSAGPAGEGLIAVYKAVDRLVGRLVETFSDARIVAFAMGGMGANHSDPASMALLPELLYRHSFGQSLMRAPEAWTGAEGGIPMLGAEEDWSQAVITQINGQGSRRNALRSALSGLLPRTITRALRRPVLQSRDISRAALRSAINWMPATHYQKYWYAMRFFALPSFYDGRIRINLAGRERDGKVSLSDYAAACDEVEEIIRGCRDTVTGDTVVDYVERCAGADPMTLGPTESDLVVVWRRATLGFNHPSLGSIGPIPYRRTGGHTGPFGMAYISGERAVPGDYGVRSSFDVVPTIIELLGETLPQGLSGSSLL